MTYEHRALDAQACMDEVYNFAERNLQYQWSQSEVGFTIFRKALLYKARTANTGRYLEFCILVVTLFLHATGSGITFVFVRYFFSRNNCGSFFCWGGVTGNSFIIQVTYKGWEGSQDHLYF